MNPKVTLVGRIGTDPESIGSGVRMRVATSDRFKNPVSNEWEDKNSSWWTVKAWKNLAEQSKSVLKKGQEVIIYGTIIEDNWVDDSGQKKTSYEIIADSIAVTVHSVSKGTSQTVNATNSDVDASDPWKQDPPF
jgi:single-strand DNA-binding protein